MAEHVRARSGAGASAEMPTIIADPEKTITVHKNRDGTVDTHVLYDPCPRCGVTVSRRLLDALVEMTREPYEPAEFAVLRRVQEVLDAK